MKITLFSNALPAGKCCSEMGRDFHCTKDTSINTGDNYAVARGTTTKIVASMYPSFAYATVVFLLSVFVTPVAPS